MEEVGRARKKKGVKWRRGREGGNVADDEEGAIVQLFFQFAPSNCSFFRKISLSLSEEM